MKRQIVMLLIIMVISSFFLLADEKQDLWSRIGQENNLETKLALLQEYENKYAQDQGERLDVLYLNLALTTYQLKQFEKTITYGEKALTQRNLDQKNKLNLCLWLANSFNVTKTDLEKAYAYAEQVIVLARELKTAEGGDSAAKYDKQYIAPALRIQIQTLYARGKEDPEMMSQAAQKGLEVYNIEPVRKNSDLLFSLSNALFNLNRKEEAVNIMEQLVEKETDNTRYIGALAVWYSKMGNKDRAIDYLEQSYQIRRNVKTAYNIAVLSQSKDLDKAIRYLAEAYQMNPSTQSRVYKLLRHLYYNVKTKGQTQEEQDQGFSSILSAAKSRLN
ncbi:MAG: tetratricopeptide repeat protein [Acidobacteriota bacterium]|nr:tetratricopeptide repeat protein [Acidobacteriota bacterium]